GAQGRRRLVRGDSPDRRLQLSGEGSAVLWRRPARRGQRRRRLSRRRAARAHELVVPLPGPAAGGAHQYIGWGLLWHWSDRPLQWHGERRFSRRVPGGGPEHEREQRFLRGPAGG